MIKKSNIQFDKILVAFISIAAICVALCQPLLAQAQMPKAGIVATVNDEAISGRDLEDRIELVLVASGLPKTLETRQRLVGQVLTTLIDEKLRVQTAKSSNVGASMDEIQAQFEVIAQRNNLNAAEFQKEMRGEGVNPQTLKNQINADISWAKYVQDILGPTIEVSFEEVERAVEKIRASSGLREYRVAEIYLEVPRAQDEATIQEQISAIRRDLQNGAPFQILARQFSQSAGAVNGGEIGWVMEGQLQEALDAALAELSVGDLSAPVRSALGFHILLKLDERRLTSIAEDEMRIDLQQIFIANKDNSDAKQTAESLSKSLKGCWDMHGKMGRHTSPLTGTARKLPISTIDPTLQNMLKTAAIGKASRAVSMSDGWMVMMVCRRYAPDQSTAPTRLEIAEQIRNERLDLLQRRTLRDLRQNGFIDIRLN